MNGEAAKCVEGCLERRGQAERKRKGVKKEGREGKTVQGKSCSLPYVLLRTGKTRKGKKGLRGKEGKVENRPLQTLSFS